MGKPRPVVKIDKYGRIVQRYAQVKQASAQNYLDPKAVIHRCQGKMARSEFLWDETHGRYFSFRYADDPTPLQVCLGRERTQSRVCKIDRDGRIVEIYPTAVIAARENGWTQSRVWRRCAHLSTREFTQADFTFRWENELNEQR